MFSVFKILEELVNFLGGEVSASSKGKTHVSRTFKHKRKQYEYFGQDSPLASDQLVKDEKAWGRGN